MKPEPTKISIRKAETAKDIESGRVLLREYAEYLRAHAGADHLDFSRFEEEVRDLPGVYTLLLALRDGGSQADEPAGCVALRPLALLDRPEKACELKRLWVVPSFRGLGLGRRLMEHAIREARDQGFDAMYLDTVPGVMVAASRIYGEMGFEPVSRYNDNPVSNVEFFRRAL